MARPRDTSKFEDHLLLIQHPAIEVARQHQLLTILNPRLRYRHHRQSRNSFLEPRLSCSGFCTGVQYMFLIIGGSDTEQVC
jgi:hypothetical protein